jgi:threonine/homoserine/homoserine lactone efflux protein
VLPIWSFLAVTLPLVLTPGASTAVVLRNSITGGMRAGVQTAAGANSGSILYGLVSAFGISVALRRWPAIWTVMQWGGAAYLGWLGLRAIGSAIWPPPPSDVTAGAHAPRSALQNVYEGLLTNTLNPAIASFYLIVLPQFVPRGAPVVRSVLSLTAIHVGVALTWHIIWAAAGGTMARWLAGGRPRRILDACSGAALIGLAIRLSVRP